MLFSVVTIGKRIKLNLCDSYETAICGQIFAGKCIFHFLGKTYSGIWHISIDWDEKEAKQQHGGGHATT